MGVMIILMLLTKVEHSPSAVVDVAAAAAVMRATCLALLQTEVTSALLPLCTLMPRVPWLAGLREAPRGARPVHLWNGSLTGRGHLPSRVSV